jgi:hypothetical protein
VSHYEPARLVSLGIAFTIFLVLIFGSVLLSLGVINVALAMDMPDAPVTQDTVTTGRNEDDNDDNEGDEDNDQPDDLPDPKDAPVTTETFTSGENEGSKEDKDDEENVEKAESPGAYNALPIQSCPNNQDRALFSNACVPVQSCPSGILSGFVTQEVENEPSNNCANTGSEAELEGGEGGSGGDVEDNTNID